VLAATGGEILELGAGTGALAEAVLTALDAQRSLPARYAILEVSADLAARQRARLGKLAPHLRERLVWLDELPRSKVAGVILANEVADALPVRRFTLHGGAVHELGVACGADGTLQSAARAPDAALAQACRALLGEPPGTLPDGYTSEVNLALEPWIATLGECLERGVLLLIDYGLPRAHYYHPQRTSGTLRCHFRQRAHDDPFINLGLQDITAWVDFTRVAEAGSGAGLEVSGFTTQAAFLLALGLEQAVAVAADTVERARLAGEARRLVMPEEMGEAFKVMALTRDYDAPLAGFALQDLRRLL
jgi:SAM-dependent MidA family methyltransferase